MPSVATVLACLTLWNPRLVIRIPTLSDLAGVFPIVAGAIVPACFACRLRSVGRRSWVTARRWRSRLRRGNSGDINGEAEQGTTLSGHAMIMVVIGKLVIGIVLAAGLAVVRCRGRRRGVSIT